MKIKGRAVKSVPFFVRRNFPKNYDEWLESLSPESREIVRGSLATKWYPIEAG